MKHVHLDILLGSSNIGIGSSRAKMWPCARKYAHPLLMLVTVVFIFLLQAVNGAGEGPTVPFVASTVSYNPDSTYSGRVHRFLDSDHTPKGALRPQRSRPAFVYNPNCSFEIILQTWTSITVEKPLIGIAHLAIPTISKSKAWDCYYRSSWLNHDDQRTNDTRYLNTFLYCPSMNELADFGTNAKTISHPDNSAGLCPLFNKAITKEGGQSINVVLEFTNLPAVAMNINEFAGARYKALQVGPVQLHSSTRRSKHNGHVTKYTSNSVVKPAVSVVSVAPTAKVAPAVKAIEDKCAADWADLTIVGRCFGLRTHTEYATLKHIPVVESGDHCKSLCCQLGTTCITWQYWTDIKLCKLGDSVRIGKEHANTNLWCDSEPPIVWKGRKIARSSLGEVKPGGESAELTTQCFGLGAEQMKFVPTGTDKPLSLRMSVSDCRNACLNSPECLIWQAHADRGCYFSNVQNAFCEPYTGGYVGGRRKCNDKCNKK